MSQQSDKHAGHHNFHLFDFFFVVLFNLNFVTELAYAFTCVYTGNLCSVAIESYYITKIWMKWLRDLFSRNGSPGCHLILMFIV